MRRHHGTLWFATTFTALIVAVAMSVSTAEAQAFDAPPALEDAIEAYVESQGDEFAGDCRDAQTGEFAGQYCYTVVGLTDQSADVRVGQALSDETILLTFANENGTWQVDDDTTTATATATRTATMTATATATRAATATATPSAPKTGGGDLLPQEGNFLLVVALGAATMAVVISGRLVTARRR
jgi:hypothetical protein